MGEKKLTDEEIVKAILQQVEYNAGIPYINERKQVKTIKFTEILDFIHRLQDDNKQLKGFVRSLEDENKVESIIFGLKETIVEQKEEIERLKDEFKTDYRNSWKNKFFGALEENRELQKQVNELKAENVILNKQVDRKDKAIVREMNIGYENERQIVKDTAKEIFDGLAERKERVKAFYGVAESVGVDIAINTIKEILKQKGV